MARVYANEVLKSGAECVYIYTYIWGFLFLGLQFLNLLLYS